jgi:nicotinate dehydrogenase subunit A
VANGTVETFHLHVNGESRPVACDGRTSLLHALRNDLGLTGARFGCGQGLCGACTVLMDGKPRLSCDIPMWSVKEARVVTIEGIARAGERHPLEEAIVAEQAGQCGYCLSGIVMAMVPLLERNPSPTRGEIDAALEHNLCRCGSHARILRAIDRAAAELRGRKV